jgi:uncharacterized membrane protein YkoI
VKRKISSQNLLLTVLFILPLLLLQTVAAAENDNSNDRNDTRTSQRGVLPENGVNNLTSQQPQQPEQPRISRGQAMNIASSRYEGNVLGIVMDSSNNWRVRMDRDGTVFNVFVNANSGAVNASSD